MAAISQTIFFKRIFLYENVWISIKISVKFVPGEPIDNILALVQIIAQRRIGDKPLSEPKVAWFTDSYMRFVKQFNTFQG